MSKNRGTKKRRLEKEMMDRVGIGHESLAREDEGEYVWSRSLPNDSEC